MTPDIQKLKKSLDEMEANIDDLKSIIDDIKYRLDGTLRIYTRYYYIARDIIGKYELFNKDLKNYRIIKNLRNLETSNKSLNADLQKIINEDNLLSKTDAIINIYEKKEENYRKRIDCNINENDDENWWIEIKKKEEKKKEKNIFKPSKNKNK